MGVDDVDVLVIGAGLAGLRCAGVLAAAGREVRVWEASDVVGGRVRTDVIDGFRCDRGFQVLNPAYPELGRAVDVEALRLQSFGPGVAVRREHGSTVWAHPLRAPARVPAMLGRGGLGLRILVAVARWAAPALRPVANTAVIKAAAPTYAPPGRHLVAASALLGMDGSAPDESVMRRHAAGILGTDGARWSLLVRHVVPNALPAQQPPLVVRRPVRLGDGRWVCGDHRDTASIQGALVSGRRTAEALLKSPV